MTRLVVHFVITVSIDLPGLNHSGSITVRLFGSPIGKTFNFRTYNMHDENSARIALFHDERYERPFMMMGCMPGQSTKHKLSGKTVTAFHSGLSLTDPNFGIVFVAISIISEAIYRVEEAFVESGNIQATASYENVWSRDFDGTLEVVAKSFEQTMKGL